MRLQILGTRRKIRIHGSAPDLGQNCAVGTESELIEHSIKRDPVLVDAVRADHDKQEQGAHSPDTGNAMPSLINGTRPVTRASRSGVDVSPKD